MDSPCYELPWTHNGVWGEGRGVLVVGGRGVVGDLFQEECVPSPGAQCLVGPLPEFGGRDICPGRGRGVQEEGEVCKAFLHGQGEVGQGVDREVFPEGRGGDLPPPVKGEVNTGEPLCEVSKPVLGCEGGEGREGLWESG